MTPYKSVTWDNNTGGPGGVHPYSDTTVHFYTFNASAQITEDSAIYIQHGTDLLVGTINYDKWKSVILYNYAPGKTYKTVTVTILQTNTGSQSYTRTDAGSTNGAGNMLIDSLKEYDHTGTLLLNRIILYTYDTHPSPLSKLNIAAIYPFPDDDDLFETGFTQHNNILLIHTISNDPGMPTGDDYEDYTGQYVYKQNGLPYSVSLPFITAPEINRIFFFYKAL